MTVKKKLSIIVLIGVVLWYGFVLLGKALLPKLLDAHGTPAFLLIMRAQCQAIRYAAAQRRDAGSRFTADDLRAIVGRMELTDAHTGNQYHVDMKPHEEDWTVVCTPEKSRTYIQPLWKRLVFLDFDQRLWPSFRIESSDLEVREGPGGGAPP